MREVFVADLAGVGREAAQAVAGGNVVKEIKAKVGHDYEGDTVYRFAFLLDPYPEGLEGGWFHIRLSMALRDALMEHDDDHYPYVRLISRADWDNHKGV